MSVGMPTRRSLCCYSTQCVDVAGVGARPRFSKCRKATRESHGPDDVKKYAFVVVLQIGQVVGEVGEVVAHAGFQVLANVTIDRGQRAAAPLTYVRQVKRAHLR